LDRRLTICLDTGWGDDNAMKAIVQEGYGSPDAVLRLAEVDRPAVDDDGVLVRVRAASVNALDWRRVRGSPFVLRLSDGLRTPKKPGLGVDTAGHVEEVGRNVTDLRPGDEAFGVGTAAFAEYTTGTYFVRKPANLTFEQAAALPVAGITALQGLRDKGKVRPGQRVLVHGAGGGVGTFTVMVAKALGAEVTATSRPDKLDLVRSLGADHVIDYTREDFTSGGERYDVIVDVGGNRSLSAYRRALAPGGTLVLAGAGHGASGPIGRFLAASFRSAVLRQRIVAFISKESTEDLLALKELVEAGRVTPVIDRTFPLEDTPEAIRYLESGNAGGKIVITV
jgi:NADPH:quinone reductase-like Zn-dependent oxidoreductase